MTPLYQVLLEKLQRIQNRYAKIVIEKVSVENELTEERRNQIIVCNCGASTRVGDIELIREDKGSYDRYGEQYVSEIHQSWVCSHCMGHFRAPKDKVLFPDGIEKCVRDVISWHSRERTPERVKVLLAPSIKRLEEERSRVERERRVAEARRILAEEENRAPDPRDAVSGTD